ncbi:MAG: recombinase family protein, partial [Ruminococcus flavefaciens]|nr:recombinase family protein [Ruminococcus flavefaciens]
MTTNTFQQVKKFMAAIYLRLSRDDGVSGSVDGGGNAGLKTESNSIGSQRELIKAFLHGQQDMELYDIYVDDGFSGSNFDRPEFKRMMADIEAGRVNCVLVKDLSRFGRDYIESGRYLQKVFPALGVRFIALTDHYDSFRADTGETGIVLPVKNFINDSYCRDISTKVKSQFEVKRKNGECV